MSSEEPLGPEATWRQALCEGRFTIQRSRSSNRYVFPPRVAEPSTGAEDLEWIEPSGEGCIYSVTVVRPKPPETPYNVVLVELAEGPRLMSRVEGLDPEKVAIGMPVRARIDRRGAEPLLVFDPA
jgi:uncharacterized OB-fold protein